jgi:hypothetical protein
MYSYNSFDAEQANRQRERERQQKDQDDRNRQEQARRDAEERARCQRHDAERAAWSRRMDEESERARKKFAEDCEIARRNNQLQAERRAAEQQAKDAAALMQANQIKIDEYEKNAKNIDALYKTLETLTNKNNIAQITNLQSTSDKLKSEVLVLQNINKEQLKTFQGTDETLKKYVAKLKDNDEKLDKILTYINILTDLISKQLVRVAVATLNQ